MTDARVPFCESAMLVGLRPSSGMRMMLVRRGAREDAHEVDTCLGTVPELDSLHGEQQRAIEGGLVDRERGDAARLCDRRALPSEVRLEPPKETRHDSNDRESGCAGGNPGAPAQLSLSGRESCGLIRRGSIQELSFDRVSAGLTASRQCWAVVSRPPR